MAGHVDLTPALMQPGEMAALRELALAPSAQATPLPMLRGLLRHIAWIESALYAATPPTDELLECSLADCLWAIAQRGLVFPDPSARTEQAGEEFCMLAAALLNELRHRGVMLCREIGGARLRLVTRDGGTVEPAGTYEFARGAYRDSAP